MEWVGFCVACLMAAYANGSNPWFVPQICLAAGWSDSVNMDVKIASLAPFVPYLFRWELQLRLFFCRCRRVVSVIVVLVMRFTFSFCGWDSGNRAQGRSYIYFLWKYVNSLVLKALFAKGLPTVFITYRLTF